ncbi:hypothetical protein FG05_35204 [Fusarium graminearum]|nr:hypothetical protein FG05_35204 [Fusarium graminearum]
MSRQYRHIQLCKNHHSFFRLFIAIAMCQSQGYSRQMSPMFGYRPLRLK